MSDGATYAGLVYRALNPRWAAEPLSGEGAVRYGGRFNAKGTAALYTSLSPVTAMREAQQAGGFQPITLVAIAARVDGVFDGRDAAALAGFGMTPAMLADAGWRQVKHGQRPPTQEFARALKAAGYAGLLVPSFAPGSGADDINLVLLALPPDKRVELRVVDDEGRLKPES